MDEEINPFLLGSKKQIMLRHFTPFQRVHAVFFCPSPAFTPFFVNSMANLQRHHNISTDKVERINHLIVFQLLGQLIQ